jgi:polar amino acid transport system substrate-binding protein
MRFLALSALLALSLLGAAAAPAAAAETIVIAGDEWCPYNCKPESANPGFCVELAREIFAAKGIAVKYVVLPWDQAVKDARAGKINAIIGALPEDAPDFVFPEREIGFSKNLFVVRNGVGWQYAGLDSLKGKKIGVIEGYAYGNGLDEYFKANPGIAQVAGGEDAKDLLMKWLLAKKIDAFIDDHYVIFSFAKERDALGLIRTAGSPGEAEGVYLAFSPAVPGSAKHAKVLSDGIVALRKSGRYAEIVGKYGIREEN